MRDYNIVILNDLQYIFDVAVIDGAELHKPSRLLMEQVQIESKFADKQGEIMVVELGGHIDQSNSDQVQKMFNNIIQKFIINI